MFEIEFPEYVENLEITNSSIMYGEGLEISNIELLENNGKIYARVNVKGVQSKLSSGLLTNGTNIILNANIKVNEYAPAKQEEIKLYLNMHPEIENFCIIDDDYDFVIKGTIIFNNQGFMPIFPTVNPKYLSACNPTEYRLYPFHKYYCRGCFRRRRSRLLLYPSDFPYKDFYSFLRNQNIPTGISMHSRSEI